MRVWLGYALVLLAALMWGCVGLFSRALGSMGFSSMEIAALRMAVASMLLVPILLTKGLGHRDAKTGGRDLLAYFRVSPRSFLWCSLVGIFGLALASATYYIAIDHIGMSTASVLMCTSPMFGVVLGRVLYSESITMRKIVSLACNVVGCIMAVTGGSFDLAGLSPLGVCMGVVAGFMGCLLTMFSKRATRDIDSLTVVFYGFAVGAMAMFVVANPIAKVMEGVPSSFGPTLMAFGLIPTVCAYLCYMKGLSYGLEASKVPVIASFETVTAIVLGIGLFDEPLNIGKTAGIVLVLISIVVMSLDISSRVEALKRRLVRKADLSLD